MQLLAVVALAASAATAHVHPPELRGEELMKALRAGGYTILLRHARTDTSFHEAIGSIPAERSAQRNLSTEGVRDAALIGLVLRRYHIPIGEIVASPMFRTRETAEYVAGTPTVAMALRVYPTTDETAALVAAAPTPGTNRLLVTHHFVIEKHVPGIRPGDVRESEAAVVRPTRDGGVELVGRITLADWEQLAGVAAHVAPAADRTASPDDQAAAANAPAGPAQIPETPAGRLARAYMDTFNSGDSTRVRAFIEQHLVPNPDRPTEARVQSWARSYKDFAPLTLVGVRSSTNDEVALDVSARSGRYILTVKPWADDPTRAASITIGTMAGGHP